MLDDDDLAAAAKLAHALDAAAANADRGVDSCIAAAQSALMGERRIRLEYLSVVDPTTFLPVDDGHGGPSAHAHRGDRGRTPLHRQRRDLPRLSPGRACAHHPHRRSDRLHRVVGMAHPHRSHVRSARPHLLLRGRHELDEGDGPRGAARGARAHRRGPPQPSRPRRQPRRRGPRGLASATTVLTTRAGAKALTHPDLRGLAAGDAVTLSAPGKPDLTITATPGRHGAPLTLPLVGPVIGFALTLGGRRPPGALDDGRHRRCTGAPPLRRRPRARGGARPHGRGAVRAVGAAALHDECEGGAWSSSRWRARGGGADPRRGLEPLHRAGGSGPELLASAPATVADRVRWAPLGEPIEIATAR